MTSFLSTLFGLGRVPDKLRAELEREGIALLDEGLSQVTARSSYASGKSSPPLLESEPLTSSQGQR